MRFVPTKTPEQQSCLMLHRTRPLFIRQQTAVINSIRAHLAEFGIVAPVGRKGVTELLHVVADPNDKRVSEVARACLAALGAQLLSLKQQILKFDRMILAWHRSNQTSKRLHYIPGVGPMLATALVASVVDPSTFRSGRNFSAWIGLVPKQHSSGGRARPASTRKKGDRMAAPTQACVREESSCQLGAVHTWHKTDIAVASLDVRFWGKSRHRIRARLSPLGPSWDIGSHS